MSLFVAFVLSLSAYAGRDLGRVDFFYSPNEKAHQPIIQAIDSARQSVKMKMFHLSDPDVADALMAAAKRGVSVSILFDKIQWKNPFEVQMMDEMAEAGVRIQKGTTGFTLTHEKAMIVDSKRAMVSTMNLIRRFRQTIDTGVFVSEPGIVREMEEVFAADWKNAQTQGSLTPKLSSPYLVWSPVNSADRIVSLIKSAKRQVSLMVENLGHPAINQALIETAARGVKVRVLVPKCNLVKLNLNYPHVKTLRAGKVDAKMYPGPSSDERPYIHAKTIVVDNNNVYLGSQNFSVNSLNFAREVGVILPDAGVSAKTEAIINGLWSDAELPPADANYTCSGSQGEDEHESINMLELAWSSLQ
jgi:cardiolipin synthase A/B